MATCNDLSGFIEALTELKTDAAKLDKFINGKATETVALGTLTSETLAGFSTRLDEYIDKLQAFADSSDPSVTIGEYAIPTLHQLVADVQADVDSFGSQLSSYVNKVGAFVNGNETATVNLGGVQVPTLRHMANDVANSVSANGAKLDTFVNGTATETVVLGNGAGATAEPTIRNMIAQINSLRQIILDSVLDVEGADLSARNATAEGGTTPRVFADRFGDVLSPKDFGAVGDGVTDDTAAWEAWDAVYGSMKFVPAGRYLVNGEIKSFAYGAYINLRETKEQDRVYVYVPHQDMDADSFDPGVSFRWPRECIVFKQGDTVVMVDTAGIEAVTMIRNFLASIGVDHVDYLIISHYHEDHCTGLSGITGTVGGTSYNVTDTLDNYIDFSRCKVFLPIACHTIDTRWESQERISAGEYDDFLLAKLQSLGITPVYPNELDTLVISNALKFTFCNAGLDALNEVFDIHAEVNGSDAKLGINDCSMCCLVEHENATMFLTGDILNCAEERLAQKFELNLPVEVTPGTVSPVPVEITGMGGSKFSYISDYRDMNGDSVGALYKASSFYRKIFAPDIFKVSHHGANSLSSTVSQRFYEILNPNAAFVVATETKANRLLNSVVTGRNREIVRCPMYNAFLEDLKFVSDGTEFKCVFGQRDDFDRSKKLVRPGDSIQPYATVAASGSAPQYAAWLRVKASVTGRRFTILAHVTGIANSQHSSALFEIKVSCFNPDSAGMEGDTYINCLYSNSNHFNNDSVMGIAYIGDNTYDFLIKRHEYAVYSISIVSITGLESILSIMPMMNKFYPLSSLESLALPKWYYLSQPGYINCSGASLLKGDLNVNGVFTVEDNSYSSIDVVNPDFSLGDSEGEAVWRTVFREQSRKQIAGQTVSALSGNRTRHAFFATDSYRASSSSSNPALTDTAYLAVNRYSDGRKEIETNCVFLNAVNIKSAEQTVFSCLKSNIEIGSNIGTTITRSVFCSDKNNKYITGLTTTSGSNNTSAYLWVADALRTDGSASPAYESNAVLRLYNYHDGTKFATVPTPSASSNDAKIATTEWVRTFVSSSSDRRDKTDFAPIGDSLLDAWDGVEFSLFRFTTLEASGDTDRLHAGVVAQDLVSALESGGMDAGDYGLVVHERFDLHERDESAPDERFRVRYNEVLTIEAAYVRRRLARIEERLATLEG